jgi:hypothetical protein
LPEVTNEKKYYPTEFHFVMNQNWLKSHWDYICHARDRYRHLIDIDKDHGKDRPRVNNVAVDIGSGTACRLLINSKEKQRMESGSSWMLNYGSTSCAANQTLLAAWLKGRDQYLHRKRFPAPADPCRNMGWRVLDDQFTCVPGSIICKVVVYCSTVQTTNGESGSQIRGIWSAYGWEQHAESSGWKKRSILWWIELMIPRSSAKHSRNRASKGARLAAECTAWADKKGISRRGLWNSMASYRRNCAFSSRSQTNRDYRAVSEKVWHIGCPLMLYLNMLAIV